MKNAILQCIDFKEQNINDRISELIAAKKEENV
jgi:hypothetical protein